jgi:hypothetical protein
MLGCPRKKRFFVTMVTLSPRTKRGAIDGYERACISSLCSCNTERTIVCTSCSNLNGLLAKNPPVAVILGSHRRVVTGSCHVVPQ